MFIRFHMEYTDKVKEQWGFRKMMVVCYIFIAGGITRLPI